MLRFWNNKEKEKNLLLLKNIAKSGTLCPKIEEINKGEPVGKDEKKEIINLLKELNQKFDTLNEILIGKRSSESPRKLRMKERIISFLHRHGNLTSSKLGKLVGLSRTRCNEYLKELEREEIATGVLVGKQRIYRLRAI